MGDGRMLFFETCAKKFGFNRNGANLGAGAFGTVWPCKDKKYCVKIVSYAKKGEITAMLRLRGKKNKNVVFIKEVYIQGRMMAVVMERLKRLTWTQVEHIDSFRRDSNSNFSSNNFISIHAGKCVKEMTSKHEQATCRQVQAGAKELKKFGITHTDIHGENFMQDAKGNIKFIDLGLIRLRRDEGDKKLKPVIIK